LKETLCLYPSALSLGFKVKYTPPPHGNEREGVDTPLFRPLLQREILTYVQGEMHSLPPPFVHLPSSKRSTPRFSLMECPTPFFFISDFFPQRTCSVHLSPSREGRRVFFSLPARFSSRWKPSSPPPREKGAPCSCP